MRNDPLIVLVSTSSRDAGFMTSDLFRVAHGLHSHGSRL